MKTRTWRGDEYDRDPRFDGATRRWFYQSITRHASEKWYKVYPRKPRLTNEQCIALAESLTPRAEEFVQWNPGDAYAGSGFAAGEWVIRWFEVCSAIEDDLRALASLTPAPTLDDLSQGLDQWLAEDIAVGAAWMPGSMSMGPHMNDVLPRGIAGTAYKQAKKRRAQWPRLCRACGQEFRGDRKRTQTCPTCIQAQHAARCKATS